MKQISIVVMLLVLFTGVKCQDIPKWKITDFEQYVSTSKEDVLVINFWATFCKPCVAELPSFIQITDKYKDAHVRLQLVSLDLPAAYPAKIRSFAAQHHFNAPIAWLDETNADIFCPRVDKTWSGSIPSTLFVNTKTGYRKFFEEELKAETFEEELKKAIKG